MKIEDIMAIRETLLEFERANLSKSIGNARKLLTQAGAYTKNTDAELRQEMLKNKYMDFNTVVMDRILKAKGRTNSTLQKLGMSPSKIRKSDQKGKGNQYDHRARRLSADLTGDDTATGRKYHNRTLKSGQ